MIFERYDERINKVTYILNKYGIADIDTAKAICDVNSIDIFSIVRNVQPICFLDACWAYVVGAAIALNTKPNNIFDICNIIGEGLQSFAIDNSVADLRKIGIGHGKLASKLLDPSTRNFAFVAGHESFAAAEGALGVFEYVNEYRERPISVSLVGLGKPAAEIISRYKGFCYIRTDYDYYKGELIIRDEHQYGASIYCYGAHSVDEGVAILEYADIDTIITGNSTSHIKFTDPTVATYRKKRSIDGKPIFCVASGGGTGRTMHPDNVGAGGASYGMTDMTGRMHCDLQFAGSSSVPAHVEMVGFIGMGNNPIVGATVSVACCVANAIGEIQSEKKE